jgi:putative endonuclease
MLRCSDGTFYTGVTTDIERRVREHNGLDGLKKGAKYTKARRPVNLYYLESAKDRSNAQIREFKIRKLPRKDKEKLHKYSFVL